MNLYGNTRRLCVVGWVAAALLLFALNVNALMALENRALGGDSRVINALRLKIVRLDEALREGRLYRFARVDDVLRRHALRPTQPPIAHVLPAEPEAPSPKEVALPVLNGIIQVTDPSRGASYLAVLDGTAYRERDRVNAFVIAKISAGSVILDLGGRQWRIESTAPFYSDDQGK